jgi:hypothetical protein
MRAVISGRRILSRPRASPGRFDREFFLLFPAADFSFGFPRNLFQMTISVATGFSTYKRRKLLRRLPYLINVALLFLVNPERI